MRLASTVATATSALTLFAPTASWAQNAPAGAPPPYDHSTAPVARAFRVNPGAVTIDGKLDEPAWASAEPVTRFTQFDPKEGEPATQRTDMRILIDGEAVYGNAVLRWEYRPGSTLYLVWQQFRSGVEPFGEFRFGRDVRGVFESRPENVLAVKATYWLPL